jgi:hypothetical protein
MIVAITGHQKLADASGWDWVREALLAALSEVSRPLIGCSSLAAGADQIFAELVLARGGELRVVLPFAAYEQTFEAAADRGSYRTLYRRAAAVEVLTESPDRERSYWAAGRRVVDLAERVLAVWDGKPAAGLGGTGDVVAYALAAGKPVLHLNPVSRHVRRLPDSP